MKWLRFTGWLIAVILMAGSLVEGIHLALVAGEPVDPPTIVSKRVEPKKTARPKKKTSVRPASKSKTRTAAKKKPAPKLDRKKLRPKFPPLKGPHGLPQLGKPPLKSPMLVPDTRSMGPDIREIENRYPKPRTKDDGDVNSEEYLKRKRERQQRRLERLNNRIRNMEERIERYRKEGKPEITIRRMELSLERQKKRKADLEKELSE